MHDRADVCESVVDHGRDGSFEVVEVREERLPGHTCPGGDPCEGGERDTSFGDDLNGRREDLPSLTRWFARTPRMLLLGEDPMSTAGGSLHGKASVDRAEVADKPTQQTL